VSDTRRIPTVKKKRADLDPAWEVAFERSLEIHETLETDRQNQANKQMESLTGDDLQRAKESNEKRKRQYQVEKKRILAQQRDLQRRGE
jgi:hypothetical protein